MHVHINEDTCVHTYTCIYTCTHARMYTRVYLQLPSSQDIDDTNSPNRLRTLLLTKSQRQKIKWKEAYKRERYLIHKEHICDKKVSGMQTSHSPNACGVHSVWNGTVWAVMYKMAIKYWWETRRMAPNCSGVFTRGGRAALFSFTRAQTLDRKSSHPRISS